MSADSVIEWMKVGLGGSIQRIQITFSEGTEITLSTPSDVDLLIPLGQALHEIAGLEPLFHAA